MRVSLKKTSIPCPAAPRKVSIQISIRRYGRLYGYLYGLFQGIGLIYTGSIPPRTPPLVPWRQLRIRNPRPVDLWTAAAHPPTGSTGPSQNINQSFKGIGERAGAVGPRPAALPKGAACLRLRPAGRGGESRRQAPPMSGGAGRVRVSPSAYSSCLAARPGLPRSAFTSAKIGQEAALTCHQAPGPHGFQEGSLAASQYGSSGA